MCCVALRRLAMGLFSFFFFFFFFLLILIVAFGGFRQALLSPPFGKKGGVGGGAGCDSFAFRWFETSVFSVVCSSSWTHWKVIICDYASSYTSILFFFEYSHNKKMHRITHTKLVLQFIFKTYKHELKQYNLL